MPTSCPNLLVSRAALQRRLDELLAEQQVIAPVDERGVVHFRPLESAADVAWDYTVSVLPPSKMIHVGREELLRFTREDAGYRTEEVPPRTQQTVLLGVHPCDLHGILVLERTLLGKHVDPWYDAARANMAVIGLNCQHVGPDCFCASFETGPFYGGWMGQGPPQGCDVLLTDLGDDYLAEVMSSKGASLLGSAETRLAEDAALTRKGELEQAARARFTKRLDITDLPAILLANLEHPVWARVGEGRCLSCSNCTIVCPTCYCYDVVDKADLDLKSIRRCRQWDSCRDQHFAEVHFGNFRSTRKARLRQFDCHKLCYWVEQYGCFGCIGCGRCILWCPTHIDLTENAAEIRESMRRA